MMDKLISQQAAINVVSEITTTMSVCTNKDECYGMKRMQKQAITELANLPSAEPDTTTHDSIPAKTGKNDGGGTSGDCISRQQAIEVLRNRWLKTRNYEGIGEDIAEECEIYLKTLPSVQPSDSKIENAIRVLQSKYNKALSQDYIRNPIAWALYQTWKEFDR